MTPLQPGPLSPGMIVSRSDIQCGEPCIAGTRVPARAIKDFHRAGYTIAQIHREYPGLTDEQLEAAIAFDGWITAPPGGWGSNPVPGRMVDYRMRAPIDLPTKPTRSNSLFWGEAFGATIIAFRLVDEATGEATTELSNDVGELNQGSSAIEADTHRATEGAVLADPCPACGALPCDWVDNPHRGKVVVPTEPTEEMIRAGEAAAWDDSNSMPAISAMRKAWAAMIAAARAKEAGE